MATSFEIHATRSPTGRAWRSVYTPDLVAVGEGPSSWTDFFTQQPRWSAGTYDVLMRQAWRVAFKLRPGAMLHYGLMLTYYPSVAIGWIMGITISACYLGFGVGQPAHRRGLVAYLLRRRSRHAVRPVLVHAAAQREPARACGVFRAFRDGAVGASPRRYTPGA